MLGRMGAAGYRVAFVLALLGASFPARIAHADAVPSPPLWCPPGQQPFTSHTGTGCMLKAPDDCEPGYHGVRGGHCVLAPCSTDQQCNAGEQCVHVEACAEERDLYWNGYGWSARLPGYSRMPIGPAPGPPPKAWVRLSICGQDGACTAPRECRATALCYPKSDIGKTKAKIVKAPAVAEVMPPGVEPTELFPPYPKPIVKMSCGRGCSVASSPSLASYLGFLLVACVTLWLRRRRKGEATSTNLARAAARRSRTGCPPRP